MAIVAGALANKPLNGGEAWLRMSWVSGLKRLGFDVFFLEQLGEGQDVSSNALAYFERVVKRFDMDKSSALITSAGACVWGKFELKRLKEMVSEAAVLINLSGNLTMDELLRLPAVSAYVDTDPGFTQIWQSEGHLFIPKHDYYFTVGENIGKRDCPIPMGDVKWLPTRQPVVLDEWPVSAGGRPDHFTTIASWRSPYGTISFRDQTFGTKVHEFRKVIDLPKRTGLDFELALEIHPNETRDLELLRQNGWRLSDPKFVAAEPDTFREYVQASGSEFSVAQGVYVATQSGWFSDRSVRYLASGKPVLVQDTGFGSNLPTGSGLLSFTTPEEAADRSANITADYQNHCKSAREIAEKYFDSSLVLHGFLTRVGIAL